MKNREIKAERIARNIVDEDDFDVLGWMEYFPEYERWSESTCLI